MCAQNKASLMVNYEHLSVACKELAVWLVDAPTEMLEVCHFLSLLGVAARYNCNVL